MYNMEVEDYVVSKIEDMPELSRMYTHQHGRSLKYRTIFFRLKKYVDNFRVGLGSDKERLVIIYGLRGIGKTTVMFQVYEYLKSLKVPPKHLIYLPADEVTSYLGSNLAKVIDVYIEKQLNTSLAKLDKPIFIFIDEAHYDKNWAAVVKTIHDHSKKIFVFVTGSSAIALDVTTDTARRSTKAPMFPLGFWEYEILKNNLYPPKGTATNIKELLMSGDVSYVKIINTLEKRMNAAFQDRNLDMDKEIMDYLISGGFGFGLTARNMQEVYKTTNDLIDKVVKNDLATIKQFNPETQHYIYRILGYLALKKPGETSHSKLANNLDTSPTNVNSLLTALEKTHMIFSIKPYTKRSKEATNLPWRYYFLTTTLFAAIRHNMGLGSWDNTTKGMLWENAVAANLFRMKSTLERPVNLFYDAEKEGSVDFLLVNELDSKIIPVEVGLNKTERQINKAIETYKSDFGVLITGISETELDGKILKVPFRTFLS